MATVSFPVRLASHPELAEHGAFSADKTYSPDEMLELVQLAGNLSVRIVPEVDGECVLVSSVDVVPPNFTRPSKKFLVLAIARTSPD